MRTRHVWKVSLMSVQSELVCEPQLPISLSRTRWLRESECDEIRSPADPAAMKTIGSLMSFRREKECRGQRAKADRQQKRNIRSR